MEPICFPKNQELPIYNEYKWITFWQQLLSFLSSSVFPRLLFSSPSWFSDSLTCFKSRSLRHTYIPLYNPVTGPCAGQMPLTPWPRENMCDHPWFPPHTACQFDHPVTLSLQGTLLRKHGKGLEKVMRALSVLRFGCVCACGRLCTRAGRSAPPAGHG